MGAVTAGASTRRCGGSAATSIRGSGSLATGPLTSPGAPAAGVASVAPARSVADAIDGAATHRRSGRPRCIGAGYCWTLDWRTCLCGRAGRCLRGRGRSHRRRGMLRRWRLLGDLLPLLLARAWQWGGWLDSRRRCRWRAATGWRNRCGIGRRTRWRRYVDDRCTRHRDGFRGRSGPTCVDFGCWRGRPSLCRRSRGSRRRGRRDRPLRSLSNHAGQRTISQDE